MPDKTGSPNTRGLRQAATTAAVVVAGQNRFPEYQGIKTAL